MGQCICRICIICSKRDSQVMIFVVFEWVKYHRNDSFIALYWTVMHTGKIASKAVKFSFKLELHNFIQFD